MAESTGIKVRWKPAQEAYRDPPALPWIRTATCSSLIPTIIWYADGSERPAGSIGWPALASRTAAATEDRLWRPAFLILSALSLATTAASSSPIRLTIGSGKSRSSRSPPAWRCECMMLKKKSSYVMAILGATGAVGKEALEILDERKFPIAALRLFASKRSAGGVLTCQDKAWTVEELTPESSFAGVDIALISATDAISREYGERLGRAGVAVIDDSGVFRMEETVPLVVPEVNAHALGSMPRGIVSIPNCTTTPLVMALKPLHDTVGVKRVIVTTFQSVSGTRSE